MEQKRESTKSPPLDYRCSVQRRMREIAPNCCGTSDRISVLPIIKTQPAASKSPLIGSISSAFTIIDKDLWMKGKGALDNYKIGMQIGRGADSVVKSGVHKSSGRRVAIKVYKKEKLTSLQRRKCLEQEIKVMRAVEHPNIVKLYDAVETAKEIYIIMEFIKGRSLLKYVKSQPGKRLGESEAAHILSQILSALRYCHSHNIAHRDIKLENVILDDSLNAKLIDFGFSAFELVPKKLRTFCGTPSYLSPEIVARREHSGPPTDMWALGVLLYAMLCGRFPFRGASEGELFREIVMGTCGVPSFVSEAGKRLIVRLLRYEPERRLSAEDAIKDPFILNNLNS